MLDLSPLSFLEGAVSRATDSACCYALWVPVIGLFGLVRPCLVFSEPRMFCPDELL